MRRNELRSVTGDISEGSLKLLLDGLGPNFGSLGHEDNASWRSYSGVEAMILSSAFVLAAHGPFTLEECATAMRKALAHVHRFLAERLDDRTTPADERPLLSVVQINRPLWGADRFVVFATQADVTNVKTWTKTNAFPVHHSTTVGRLRGGDVRALFRSSSVSVDVIEVYEDMMARAKALGIDVVAE